MDQVNQILEIDNDYILAKVKGWLGDRLIDAGMQYDIMNLIVKPDATVELLRLLKQDEELKFDFLTDLCGIHFPDQKGNELGVIYHVHSFNHNIRLRIKSFVPVEHPVVQTMTSLYASANWMERETYDFYGIIFDGHPDLRRILNMDEMEYFPLRKEYPLQDATRTDKEDKYFGR